MTIRRGRRVHVHVGIDGSWHDDEIAGIVQGTPLRHVLEIEHAYDTPAAYVQRRRRDAVARDDAAAANDEVRPIHCGRWMEDSYQMRSCHTSRMGAHHTRTTRSGGAMIVAADQERVAESFHA